MIKAADFPDNPANPAYHQTMGDMHRVHQLHSTDQPEVHGIAADMRAIADSYSSNEIGERVLIGEIYLPVDRLMHYYGRECAGVHLPFNFQLIDAPWQARALATLIADYETALPPGGWPNWVIARNFTKRHLGTAPGFEITAVAIMLSCQIQQRSPVIDECASRCERLACGADIDVMSGVVSEIAA